MEIRLKTPEREYLSINFTLSPFITEWSSAQSRFIAAITREFGELLLVRPRDFSSNLSAELGESWCKYRIYGGTNTLVLNPDTLRLDFPALSENDYPLTIEIIRCSLNLLSKDLGGYTKDNFSLGFNHHVETVEAGTADHYLEQFELKQPVDEVKTDLEVEYRPSTTVILSDKARHWLLRRSVEKSEVIETNGLFVTTHISISSSYVMAFEDKKQLVARIHDLANQALGLKYPVENNDDATP